MKGLEDIQTAIYLLSADSKHIHDNTKNLPSILEKLESKIGGLEDNLNKLNIQVSTSEAYSLKDSERISELWIKVDGNNNEGGVFGKNGLDSRLSTIETENRTKWKIILLTSIVVAAISNFKKIIELFN